MYITKDFTLLNKRLHPAAGWGLVYFIIILVGLHTYINWKSPVFLLGVLCLFMVSLPANPGQPSQRFAYVSLVFAILSIFLPVKTILYLSGCAGLLFVVESHYGRVSHAAVFTLVIMSPVFEYAVNVFGFPIRLHLTSLAAGMISVSGQRITSEGNMLSLNGNEFLVDPGCMGLNMIEVSLLLAIMITCYQAKFLAKLRVITFSLILVITLVCNIASNLFRIIAIVQFDIKPGTIMHEIIGLACLLLYVIVPIIFLIRMILRSSVKKLDKGAANKRSGTHMHLKVLYLFVAAAMSLALCNTIARDKQKHFFSKLPLTMPGYSVERIDADILKLNSPASLVYIKNIRGFYSTEHNPMICWKGSGYIFSKVNKTVVEGTLLYTAILTKGNDHLYTAWWYDNKTSRTISQLTWRWDVLKGGDNYSLINVTSSCLRDMELSIGEILKTGSLNNAM